jgi:hypothetical protein
MKAARLPPGTAAAQPAPMAPKRSGPPIGLLALVALAAVVVIGLVAALFAIPGIVRTKCIAAAADRGVILTIDSVSVGLGSVRLVKVGFKLDGVSQLTGTADSVDVALSGLTPTTANATALTIALDGAAEEVQTALDGWRAAQSKKVRPASGSGAAANKLSFGGARIVWTRAFGQTAKLEALDVQGQVDGGTNAVTFASEKVSVTAGRAVFGPWRASLERDAQGTRTHVELDPVVHGGPQATYVRDAAGVVSLKVSVPSSPLSRLGVPAKSVGLGSDPTVEGTLDLEEALTGATTLSTTLNLSKATFSGLPIDAKLQLAAAGDATRGLDVKKGDLVAGPLHATVTGTITLFADGARMALAWRSSPIPCATLAKQFAAQSFGPLGAQLGSLADQIGGVLGVKVTGEAMAAGLITLDSRDVAATSTTMTTNETCGLALF